MNKLIAIVIATTLCVLAAGCASGGATGATGGSGGGSGITVFGTIDTGVSGYKSQSK